LKNSELKTTPGRHPSCQCHVPTLRHRTQKHNNIQQIMFLLSRPPPNPSTSHCQPHAKKWLRHSFAFSCARSGK